MPSHRLDASAFAGARRFHVDLARVSSAICRG